ncbi:hypothetical protein UlMin_031237 [Ulmus minor]
MANSKPTLLSFIFFITALAITFSFTAAMSGDKHRLSWVAPSKTGCQGSIAECMVEDAYEMGSESNRRILATSQYISYGALQRNTVPCSRRGASYYNCQQGAQANPYNRACSSITRCRS